MGNLILFRSGRCWIALALALAAGLMTDPALAGSGTRPLPPWQTSERIDHPLVGRIWDVANGRFVSPEELVLALARHPVVLLGEKHDNPDHHRLQAWVLQSLTHSGRRPAVAFEMISDDQADALSDHLQRDPTDAAGLGKALGWEDAGWPSWSHYQPIAETALAAGLPLHPGNLSTLTTRLIGRHGPAALDPETRRNLGLDRSLPAPLQTAMRREIQESHCGHLPEKALNPMIDVQRARDAAMALALAKGAAQADGAVLIAGFGHTRADRGVPMHLAGMMPGRRVASLAFLEVSQGRDDPDEYAGTFDVPELPFDFVWFTPRLNEHDPCELFAQQLESLKKR